MLSGGSRPRYSDTSLLTASITSDPSNLLISANDSGFFFTVARHLFNRGPKDI